MCALWCRYSHVETTKRLIAAEADAARQRSAMKELTRQWEVTVREQQKQHDAALARAMEELEARKSQMAGLQAELDARTPEAEVRHATPLLRSALPAFVAPPCCSAVGSSCLVFSHTCSTPAMLSLCVRCCGRLHRCASG